jgi:hypothetical protein
MRGRIARNQLSLMVLVTLASVTLASCGWLSSTPAHKLRVTATALPSKDMATLVISQRSGLALVQGETSSCRLVHCFQYPTGVQLFDGRRLLASADAYRAPGPVASTGWWYSFRFLVSNLPLVKNADRFGPPPNGTSLTVSIDNAWRKSVTVTPGSRITMTIPLPPLVPAGYHPPQN